MAIWLCHNSFATFNAHWLFQVHSDGFISLQTTGSSPASKESDPVISVYLSDVDTSGIGQIYYGYNIMHYRTWTLKIKSSMCIINFASRVSTLVEQLRCVMEPVVTVCFQAGDKQLILSLAVWAVGSYLFYKLILSKGVGCCHVEWCWLLSEWNRSGHKLTTLRVYRFFTYLTACHFHVFFLAD